MRRFQALRWGFVCILALLPVLLPAAAHANVATLTAPTRIEDDDRRMAFKGVWAYDWDQSSSGWSQQVSTQSGSSATVKFSGTGVALLAPLRADGGIANIRLDGSLVATVSLFASAPTTSAPVWSAIGLAPGEHTLAIAPSDSRDASSSGTAVVIDAVDVEGTVLAAGSSGTVIQQDDPRIYRKSPWYRRTSGTASKGSALYSSKAGSAITVKFSGTGITWMGRKAPNGGLAEIILDGRRVATVGGGPDVPIERRILYSVTGLTSKTHKLTVRALGQPSLEGSGTVVDADAFVVNGKVLFCERPTPFHYPWKTYIVIDKSDYRLYWVKDKMLVKSYPVAHGKHNCTPTRVWKIKAKYHTSPGSVYGPRKMRLFKRVGTRGNYHYVFTAYGIHGTNQPWVIGTQASHGCIRMYNKDVLELFPKVPMGTMVVTRA